MNKQIRCDLNDKEETVLYLNDKISGIYCKKTCSDFSADIDTWVFIIVIDWTCDGIFQHLYLSYKSEEQRNIDYNYLIQMLDILLGLED